MGISWFEGSFWRELHTSHTQLQEPKNFNNPKLWNVSHGLCLAPTPWHCRRSSDYLIPTGGVFCLVVCAGWYFVPPISLLICIECLAHFRCACTMLLWAVYIASFGCLQLSVECMFLLLVCLWCLHPFPKKRKVVSSD